LENVEALRFSGTRVFAHGIDPKEEEKAERHGALLLLHGEGKWSL
jgi:hypothetical protein